ncbi:hypothetical protein [Parapedobacter defluvii]|uniref:hypothetical protein n=1 Tax=Parapedobacter defluvii TaxID=2045106 RepID=UPI003341DAF4
MGSVTDTPVQRLVARVELVAVAQTKAPKVKLCHPRKLPVAPHIRADTEIPA